MLGFAGLQGTDATNGTAAHVDDLIAPTGSVDPAAPFKIYAPVGPPHEFGDVLLQLCGPNAPYQPGRYPPITMSGFVDSYQQAGLPSLTCS